MGGRGRTLVQNRRASRYVIRCSGLVDDDHVSDVSTLGTLQVVLLPDTETQVHHIIQPDAAFVRDSLHDLLLQETTGSGSFLLGKVGFQTRWGLPVESLESCGTVLECVAKLVLSLRICLLGYMFEQLTLGHPAEVRGTRGSTDLAR